MSDDVLPAHSLAEAYCYLMATPCPACGKGPLRGAEPKPVDAAGARRTVVIEATCPTCEAVRTPCFRIPADAPAPDSDEFGVVNPTAEPSRILDVAQWIMLHEVHAESARREKNRAQTRRLNLEAARCLEEALKFYDEVGNDLPPSEGFFQEATRRRFRQNPERFSRRRLLDLRAGLPTPLP